MAPLNILLFNRAELGPRSYNLSQLLNLPESALSQIATLDPPPGIKRNFTNPNSIGGVLMALSCLGIIITMICVIIRAWSIFKLASPVKWAWSDTTFALAIIAALVMFIAMIQLSVPTAAVGLGIDTYLFIVPLVAINTLKHINIQKRIAITSVFATGFLAIIASILSVVYRLILNKSGDHTWNCIPVFAVAAVELFIGMIIACTPHIAKFVRTYHKRGSKVRSMIAYTFCCGYARMGSGKSNEASGGSLSTPTPKKPRKLYPGLDISTTGGTMGGTMGGTTMDRTRTATTDLARSPPF
ncbi:hypothetical protein NHQ30_009179 [Ciborinia camelliae]|nr:hypothetical protein NHQ30_009179 [Ciborinia camelliae]